MCGIFGYTGHANAIPKITDGLTVLEYRGYDSAGLAAFDAGSARVRTVKCCGRIGVLKKHLAKEADDLQSTCAIGHTRWATHGAVTDVNAHPHTAGMVTLVHNGIIENEKEWRERLHDEGVSFLSETDTEVAAFLLNRTYATEKNPVRAIFRALSLLRGSYAFAILFADRPGEIYAVRKDSPLLLCRDEEGSYLASDLTALLPHSRYYFCLEEGMVARLTADDIVLFDHNGHSPAPRYEETEMEHEAASKGSFDTYMEKEIHEQPAVMAAALRGRIQNGMPDMRKEGLTDAFLASVREVHIVACGSAVHAGMIGGRFLERDAGIPCHAFIASEYRYHMPPTTPGTLVLLISQSGETADTLAALRAAHSAGLPTLAIVNAENSSIAREADSVLYTHAGPEIAVATTKGYCTQVLLLMLFSLALASARRTLDDNAVRARCSALTDRAPDVIREVIARREELFRLSETFANAAHLFYIGRGRDYALAMEGSLKLKEISYLHSEAYAAGELKHGTISLIESGTPVIALCTESELAEKMAGNLREVASRGADVILLCREKDRAVFPAGIPAFLLPEGGDEASIFAAMAAMQHLAYKTALLRNCDIDRPRNLAKSVTVE